VQVIIWKEDRLYIKDDNSKRSSAFEVQINCPLPSKNPGYAYGNENGCVMKLIF